MTVFLLFFWNLVVLERVTIGPNSVVRPIAINYGEGGFWGL